MRSVKAMDEFLIVKSDIAEELAHGLVVVDATDSFAEHQRDVHRLDLVAAHLLHLVRYSVRHNHLQYIL